MPIFVCIKKMDRRHFIKLMGFTPLLATPASWHFLNDATPQLCGLKAPSLQGTQYKLQPQAAKALMAMQDAAKKEGIQLTSRSSYRSFHFQRYSWNRRMNEWIDKGLSPEEALKQNLKYVAIPGTSRHHWGTDVDLLDASQPTPRKGLPIKHFEAHGRYFAMHNWLQKNAHRFNFHLVYTDNPSRKGFQFEPWHYSYAPIAKPLLKNMLLIDYQKLWQPHKIVGKELMTESFMKKYLVDYLLGVNRSLLPIW
jgi:LAS superfamily LD-carboxypeptidase LdcB